MALDTKVSLGKKAPKERVVTTKEEATIKEGTLGVEDHPLEEDPKVEDLLDDITATKRGTWPIGVRRRLQAPWERGGATWCRNLIAKVWKVQRPIKVSILLIAMATLKEERIS